MIAYICSISFWTDSEIWASVVVKAMFTGSGYYDFSLKPLFNIILLLNYRLSEIFGWHPMILARTFFALNLLFVAWIFLSICKRLQVSSRAAYLTLFLCATNSFFIKRFGQVRSDVMATTLILGLIWWFLRDSKIREKPWLTVFVSFLAFALSAGITAKCIPLVAAVTLLFHKKKNWQFTIIFFAAIVSAVILLSNNWQILMDSIPATLMGSSYWDVARLEHVIRVFKENPLMFAVLLANFGCAFSPSLVSSVEHRRLSWLACFAWIYLLVFPDRLPFFIASLLPLFFLPFAPLLESRRFTLPLKAIAVGFGVFSLMYWSARIIYSHNFRVQLDYSNWARTEFGSNPALNIYDPVGIIPYSNAFNWYLGPAERGNSTVMKLIEAKKTDVIFYTQRLDILEPQLGGYLAANYSHDDRGLYIRKIDVDRSILKDDRLHMKDLRQVLEQELPNFLKAKEQPFAIEVRAGVINLTRFTKLVSADVVLPFSGQLSAEETELDMELRLPAGTASVYIYPIKRQTPSSYSWSELFRFDPEF